MTQTEETQDESQNETAVDRAELTLRDIIAQNEFTENHAVLVHEINQIEDLFELTKGMLLEEVNANKLPDGKPPRLGTVLPNKKRNMMFISSQTTNLISMRNLKMSLIKHQITLKTDMLDRNIKTLAQIAKDKTGGDDTGNPGAILDFLINNLNISIPISPQQRKDMLPFYGKTLMPRLSWMRYWMPWMKRSKPKEWRRTSTPLRHLRLRRLHRNWSTPVCTTKTAISSYTTKMRTGYLSSQTDTI